MFKGGVRFWVYLQGRAGFLDRVGYRLKSEKSPKRFGFVSHRKDGAAPATGKTSVDIGRKVQEFSFEHYQTRIKVERSSRQLDT